MHRLCSAALPLIVASLAWGQSARADGLEVATSPSPPPSTPSIAAQPSTAAHGDAKSEKPVERKGVSLGGSMYVLAAPVLENFHQMGILLRPEIELYASFGLGNVSLFVGGTVLGIEGGIFGDHKSASFPALATIGIKGDKFQLAAAGGASLGFDNSYGDINDNERSLPCPRAELRGGYRLGNFGELTVIGGAERALFENRAGATRVFLGLALGYGGDGNQHKL